MAYTNCSDSYSTQPHPTPVSCSGNYNNPRDRNCRGHGKDPSYTGRDYNHPPYQRNTVYATSYRLPTHNVSEIIDASDLNDLLSTINSEERRRWQTRSNFRSVSRGSVIDDSDFNQINNSPILYYSRVSAGDLVRTEDINSAIQRIKSMGAVCFCDSNYCSCNCNNCTCNCNNCTCNGHY